MEHRFVWCCHLDICMVLKLGQMYGALGQMYGADTWTFYGATLGQMYGADTWTSVWC